MKTKTPQKNNLYHSQSDQNLLGEGFVAILQYHNLLTANLVIIFSAGIKQISPNGH